MKTSADSSGDSSNPSEINQEKNTFPPLQLGIESLMVPRPIVEDPNYQGFGKLKDKVAVITIAYYYRYSRQCGCTGADLDTAHSGELFCGIYRVKVGDGCTDETAGTAL
jgi:hypothetical protein